MRVAVALVGLMTLTACMEAVPQGAAPEDAALFDGAVASVGCQMIGESDYLPVELQTGLTREQVVHMIQFKVLSGEAEKLPKGGFKFKSGACA